MIVGVRVGGSVGLGVAEGLGVSVRVGSGEGLGGTVAVGDGAVQPANPMNKAKIKPKMGVIFIIAHTLSSVEKIKRSELYCKSCEKALRFYRRIFRRWVELLQRTEGARVGRLLGVWQGFWQGFWPAEAEQLALF